MTTYSFEQIDCAPNPPVPIRTGYPNRQELVSIAREWLALYRYTIIDEESDDKDDGHDFMTTRNGCLFQFAVNPKK